MHAVNVSLFTTYFVHLKYCSFDSCQVACVPIRC